VKEARTRPRTTAPRAESTLLMSVTDTLKAFEDIVGHGKPLPGEIGDFPHGTQNKLTLELQKINQSIIIGQHTLLIQ
jgi:hypothetical protein